MKKVILVSILIVLLVGLMFAQEKKGGVAPCLASCLVGPRVGLEMNEGQDVYQSEWIALGGALVGGAMGGAVGAGLGEFFGITSKLVIGIIIWLTVAIAAFWL